MGRSRIEYDYILDTGDEIRNKPGAFAQGLLLAGNGGVTYFMEDSEGIKAFLHPIAPRC